MLDRPAKDPGKPASAWVNPPKEHQPLTSWLLKTFVLNLFGAVLEPEPARYAARALGPVPALTNVNAPRRAHNP